MKRSWQIEQMRLRGRHIGRVPATDKRREASTALYEILRNRKEVILAFAIAEAALHDNPQHSIRFRLGLDYQIVRP